MTCCHDYVLTEGGDGLFAIDTSPTLFGAGALAELGDHADRLGIRRVALFTDPRLAGSEHVTVARASLERSGLDVTVYDEVHVEPTDASFVAATRFAREGSFDGFVSIGGGSVIDTTKAANLYSSHPADFLAYVNAPIGDGRPVPGPLKPHIACPTTAGTGSENTGIAIFDLVEMRAKTGIVSGRLRPTLAVVDPKCTRTLPKNVAAAGAFDVLSHALESFTARPFTRRKAPDRPRSRPSSQGANPWSDIGCREALRLLGRYLVRGVTDPSDEKARETLSWAASLAGIAFGNAGCHLPHGMSYSVSGLVRDFHAEGYPDDEPMVPHGMSVIVNAPSVFRFTATACPERHLEAAALLGADTRGASADDAGELLGNHLIELMRRTEVPLGLEALGYSERDLDRLTEGSFPQKRLIDNAPLEVDKSALSELYRGALTY
jgi:hydroxyacid-oxoacid transhydrogenase